MKTVLVAGGDVGGVRALIPVLKFLETKDVSFIVLSHGFLSNSSPKHWVKVSININDLESRAKEIFLSENIGLYLFSTSVKDTAALCLARVAKSCHIPVICLLDGWMNYHRRLKIDSKQTLLPDVYAVMDNFAKKEAIADGIPDRIIRIVGQPALESLAVEVLKRKEKDILTYKQQLGLNSSKKLVLFVSEPVEFDNGIDEKSPTFRGYTEKSVLQRFCLELQQFHKEIYVILLPHPRENKESLFQIWDKFHGKLTGEMLCLKNGRDALLISDGVAGMASILLYEAWLIGKKIVSLQPGVRNQQLSFVGQKRDVFFVKDENKWTGIVTLWIHKVINSSKRFDLKDDLFLHKNASENVYLLIKQYLRSE